ncbi:tetratricopeptide repeat protein [Luteimonas sp. RC10]|uniref:tetratricopeptide repeat protein n=1 Tax=Luteimonas sp. RC10 TaxID=2587035 RepID=UPI0016173B63|nr:tetratricopeptide repeat protein [Luteimonas sp. RC10]MBB3343304.1 cytochrome c-type biogenesis protein CcmH [Luteimonas sp. RC10]
MAVFVAIAICITLATVAMLVHVLRTGAPRVALAVAVLVPVLVGGLYTIVGTPAALDPQSLRAPGSLEEAITRLQADLERDPRQPEGWLLLGRSYAAMQEPGKARDAIERAAKLLPDDDTLQVEYARARAEAHPQRRFDDTAVEILRTVLARNPEQQHARWFLGIAQRQAGDDAAAVATWEPLLAQLDGETAATLREQIAAAREAAGMPAAVAPATETATASPARALHVRVRIAGDAAALAARLPPEASVFVMARQPGGPPMPVAAQRHRLSALPLDIVLDDDDSPMPTQPLSALDEVEVVARIAARGIADRSPDDLESAPVRVSLPSADTIELVIEAPRP